MQPEMPHGECVSMDCCGPRKHRSRKTLLMIVLAVILVIAAISPFVYGMAETIYLRNNPDKYLLKRLFEASYRDGTSFELRVQLPEAADSPLDELLNNSVLKMDVSAINPEATGENLLLSGNYALEFRNRLFFKIPIQMTERGMQFTAGASSMYITFPQTLRKSDLFPAETPHFKALIEDQRFREMVRRLFTSAKLSESGKKDELTGETCDVIQLHLTARDLFQFLCDFVEELKTNQAIRNFLVETFKEALNSPFYMNYFAMNADETAKETAKEIESGAFIDEAVNAFSENKELLQMVFGYFQADFDLTFYLTGKGPVRTDTAVSVTIPDFMSGHDMTYAAELISYRNALKAEGERVRTENEVLLDPQGIGSVSDPLAMQRFMKDFFDMMINSEAYRELETLLRENGHDIQDLMWRFPF